MRNSIYIINIAVILVHNAALQQSYEHKCNKKNDADIIT